MGTMKEEEAKETAEFFGVADRWRGELGWRKKWARRLEWWDPSRGGERECSYASIRAPHAFAFLKS